MLVGRAYSAESKGSAAAIFGGCVQGVDSGDGSFTLTNRANEEQGCEASVSAILIW